MMKYKSQTIRIISRMLQMAILLVVVVGGGFLLPLYVAPQIFSALSMTPIGSQSVSQVSVSIQNRNLNNGETVQFTVSAPSAVAHITSIRYSCDIQDITLLYTTNSGTNKQLPCETNVFVPAQRSHELQLRTSRSDTAYIPITVRVDADGRTDEISSIIAGSFDGVDQKSELSDRTQVTFDRFGVSR